MTILSVYLQYFWKVIICCINFNNELCEKWFIAFQTYFSHNLKTFKLHFVVIINWCASLADFIITLLWCSRLWCGGMCRRCRRFEWRSCWLRCTCRWLCCRMSTTMCRDNQILISKSSRSNCGYYFYPSDTFALEFGYFGYVKLKRP